MSESPMSGPESDLPADVKIAAVPAIYVNHVHVAVGNDIVRLTLAETTDGKHFFYRGAFTMKTDTAELLVKLLTGTLEKAKALDASEIPLPLK